MEFKNLTPFHATAFGAFNVHDEEFHAVALKVAYTLTAAEATTPGRGEAVRTHRCEIAVGDAYGAIVVADRYAGELNLTEVTAESDLAAFKPRCDVVVQATARAPGGVAAPRWLVRLRVSTDGGVEVDKTLAVCGPRSFQRAAGAWTLGEPAAVTEVPLGWARAFGGRSRVVDAEGRSLLDEVCFTNPLGQGWIDARWEELARRAEVPIPEELAGPQVERPDAPVTVMDVVRHPDGIVDAAGVARAAEGYKGAPAGLSWVGRAWTPRIQRAGTYDDAWLRERHPFLPTDFSFEYWNGAPRDQQIAWPSRGLDIELWNLTPQDASRDGYVGFEIPPHRAFVMAYVSGAPIPVPARLDTITLDTESMKVACVWRALVPRALRPERIEARFETNPDARLLQFKREG